MKKVLLVAAISSLSMFPTHGGYATDLCFDSAGSSSAMMDSCLLNALSQSTSNIGGTVTGTSSIIVTTPSASDTVLSLATTTSQALDTNLELNAPNNEIISNNISYTPWEMIHRAPMLAGFVWTGPIANFITPNMYIGTPFGTNADYLGSTNPFAKYLITESTNYEECLRNESFISFGLGQRIEDSDIKEFKAIAKTCAKEFYGSYFGGKSYTTREEFLMMLFTMFEEKNVGFQGHFDNNGKYIKSQNDGSITGYSNVDPRSWSASYLKLAKYLTLVDPDETTWQAAKSISDTEAVEMLALYTAYRMNFEGDSMDRGVIQTEKMKYNLSFPTGNEVTIRIQ